MQNPLWLDFVYIDVAYVRVGGRLSDGYLLETLYQCYRCTHGHMQVEAIWTLMKRKIIQTTDERIAPWSWFKVICFSDIQSLLLLFLIVSTSFALLTGRTVSVICQRCNPEPYFTLRPKVLQFFDFAKRCILIRRLTSRKCPLRRFDWSRNFLRLIEI